ncbi:hypothetical protein KIH87_11775 [Paraneptunicella aestuarii]|uniref:hypothetical protein n=1 Tax=Paraneptunicella aestuarii TaxID=2831148 RepID=UPI001E5649C8|nr:hypothetical protein [Paraneptunicella aestuarii]UAA37393.1 hypothetical protein KIH87_11775 [Paraneptunicella aestuarii]
MLTLLVLYSTIREYPSTPPENAVTHTTLLVEENQMITEPKTSKLTIIREGRNAFLADKSEQANPYNEGTDFHALWMAGFVHAAEEQRKSQAAHKNTQPL